MPRYRRVVIGLLLVVVAATLVAIGFATSHRLSRQATEAALVVAEGAALALLLAVWQMGTELRQRTRALQEADELKDEFLATLSHELRTPLNAIVGWTQVLKLDGTDGAQRLQAIEGLERNARAQTRLVEDLLDVSRLLQGRLRLQVAPVDLQSVVLAAADTVAAAADLKGVRLEVGPLHAPLFIRGDPRRLQQVVRNLLSNAIKFTPRHGHILVAADGVGGHARIRVRDSGEGINPALLRSVFDDFRQGPSRSMRSGSGLGLAIVRRLVELHGGTIGAESAGPGQGSLFTATFPLADAVAAPVTATATVDDVAAPIDAGAGPHSP